MKENISMKDFLITWSCICSLCRKSFGGCTPNSHICWECIIKSIKDNEKELEKTDDDG